MLRCDLENVSRSLMSKLEISVMGIHPWCKFGDSTSKVKKDRDVKVYICFIQNV